MASFVNDNITPEVKAKALMDFPEDSMVFETLLSKDEIIRLIVEEYVYWRDSDSEVSISATGATSNIIGKIVMNFHPEETK